MVLVVLLELEARDAGLSDEEGATQLLRCNCPKTRTEKDGENSSRTRSPGDNKEARYRKEKDDVGWELVRGVTRALLLQDVAGVVW